MIGDLVYIGGLYSVLQSFFFNYSSLDSSGWWEKVSVDGVVDLRPKGPSH